ncbi:MAG: hypothetical protein K2I67_00180 [Malacoplasma sp.]|nr:hypothetical protein [Malacoplasma sp.]
MIERLIKEVEGCLKNELYMSALTVVLTLPDICGKAEFHELGNGERYRKWLDQYVCSKDFNIIRSEEIYKLRNSMLHQGAPTTKKKGEDIDEFELLIQDPNRASKMMQSRYQDFDKCVLSVNIESLCEIICSASQEYYAKNKEKFDFINYRIVNTDYRTAKMFRMSDEVVKIKI